jgi:hypothetical protein
MTMPIMVVPEVLALGSAVENAGAATMAGATGATGPEMTAVLPLGLDGASIAAQGALVGHGATAIGMMTGLTAARTVFAETIGVNGVSYAAVDGINQATLAL